MNYIEYTTNDNKIYSIFLIEKFLENNDIKGIQLSTALMIKNTLTIEFNKVIPTTHLVRTEQIKPQLSSEGKSFIFRHLFNDIIDLQFYKV